MYTYVGVWGGGIGVPADNNRRTFQLKTEFRASGCDVTRLSSNAKGRGGEIYERYRIIYWIMHVFNDRCDILFSTRLWTTIRINANASAPPHRRHTDSSAYMQLLQLLTK